MSADDDQTTLPKTGGADRDPEQTVVDRHLRGPRRIVDPIEAPPVFVDAPNERYRVVESIGRGGMGEVNCTLDHKIGREVALKMIRTPDGRADAAAEARFLREARIQALLEHPAIVPVYDIDKEADGRAYFTMKRIRGETLGAVLVGMRADAAAGRPARVTSRRLLAQFVTVCLAVHYAHERGVVHRDLKPENVMLGPHGEVYVLDWGVAKVLTGREGALAVAIDSETGPGETVGTLGFMPPEQVLGHHDEVEPRSDVYALGAMLHEILTLQPLHPRAGNRIRLVQATLDQNRVPPPAPPDVPPELFQLAHHCTRFQLDERPASARVVADAVERYLDGDRDQDLRRRLADERAANAREEATRALEGPPETRDAARAVAMREAGRALALTPEHAGAAETVLALLAHPPTEVPEDAKREIDALERRHLTAAVRDNALRIASWSLLLPFPIAMGVRTPGVLAAVFASYALCAVVAVWSWRADVIGAAGRLSLYLLSCVFAASVSAGFGPLVLVPGFVAMNTVIFAAQARRSERSSMIVLGMLVICVPLLLELAGLVPPSMRFEPDAILILPRAVTFAPAVSLGFLVAVALLGVLTPTMLTGRLREELRRAERDLVVQKWQFAQLSPRARG